MPLALPPRYHTVTLTIVRRYLNVTRRYLKKDAGYRRPRASFYWASHYGVLEVQRCQMAFKTCLEPMFLITLNILILIERSRTP